MIKMSKQALTVSIIILVVGGVFIFKNINSTTGVSVDPVESRSKGPESAKVKIVEFIDLECPACARGAMILKEYLVKYPDQIRLQVKYYPLMNIHRHALQVAYYAECSARQGKFWPFFEPLMASQQQWSQLVNAEAIFDQLAQGASVDMGQLKSCVKSTDVTTTITAEKTVGRSMGVQSTPTYFINGNMVVGTKSLVEELDKYFPNPSKK